MNCLEACRESFHEFSGERFHVLPPPDAARPPIFFRYWQLPTMRQVALYLRPYRSQKIIRSSDTF